MTIESDDIESVIGPLRQEHPLDRRFMRLSNMPDRVFTESTKPPVCDWLGETVDADDYIARLKRDGEVPRRSPEAVAAMTPTAFLAFPDTVPVLASGHRWSLIDHCVAGRGAGQRRFCGLRLAMRTNIAELAGMIHRRFFGTDVGCGKPTLDTLGAYRAMLRSTGLDCNESYFRLAEGFYPVDYSQEMLDRVADGAPRFEDLIRHPDNLRIAAELAIIAIVAPNSD